MAETSTSVAPAQQAAVYTYGTGESGYQPREKPDQKRKHRVRAELRGLFARWLATSSVKGVPRIIKPGSNFLRGFWLTSVLLLITISAYFVMQNVLVYLHYPSSTVFKDVSVPDVLDGFPEATFCNLSPLKSRSAEDEEVIDFVNFTQMVTEDIINSPYYSLESRKIEADPLTLSLLSYLTTHEGYFEYIGQSDAAKVGHQQEDFLVSCDILYEVSSSERRKARCSDYAEIRQYVTPQFFNCYSVIIHSARVREDYGGIPTGLSVILHLDTSYNSILEFYDAHSDNIHGSGAMVMLHQRNTLPNVWEQPVKVPPGYYIDITHDVMARRRLDKPHGSCSSKKYPAYWSLDGRPLLYTKPACLKACTQSAIVRECGCFDPALNVAASPEHLKLPYCATYANKINETLKTMHCVQRAKLSRNVSTCSNNSCLSTCQEVLLPARDTLSVWPTRSQHLWFYDRVIRNRRFKDKYKVYLDIWELVNSGEEEAARSLFATTTLIQNNFVKIKTSLETTAPVLLEDQPLWSLASIMSQIGGVLNLYSGISLIVLIELAELLYRLISLMWRPLVRNAGMITERG